MPPVFFFIFSCKLVQYGGFCKMLPGLNFQLSGHRGGSNDGPDNALIRCYNVLIRKNAL